MTLCVASRFTVRCIARRSAAAACTAGLCTGLAWAGGPAEAAAHLADRAGDMVTANATPISVSPEFDAVHARLNRTSSLPLGSDGQPMNELAGVNYRLWMGRGATQLGVGMGALGYVQRSPDPRAEQVTALAGTSPTVTVGLRHRVDRESTVYADAVGARSLGGEPHAGYVGAKVGMEWKPAARRFGFEHGALGVHLDSGYHLALKAHHGGVGLYLRGKF